MGQAINDLDGFQLFTQGFAFRDIIGQERWISFVPVFTSLAVVGATSYSARWRPLGHEVEFQVQLSAATSIASVSGTTYMDLPVQPAKGLAGNGDMQNITSKVAAGNCVVDVANSRLYLPTQPASNNVFVLMGRYEV